MDEAMETGDDGFRDGCRCECAAVLRFRVRELETEIDRLQNGMQTKDELIQQLQDALMRETMEIEERFCRFAGTSPPVVVRGDREDADFERRCVRIVRRTMVWFIQTMRHMQREAVERCVERMWKTKPGNDAWVLLPASHRTDDAETKTETEDVEFAAWFDDSQKRFGVVTRTKQR